MTVPVFTGNVPSRLSSPETFSADTDSYHAELPAVIAGMNATAIAMNLNSTTDTSPTSLTIGTGSKSLTVSTGKSFQQGMYLILADSTAPTVNSMVVQVDSYNTGTGAMVANCVQVKGSGTLTSWVISQTAPPSSDVSATMLPVVSAASLVAARTALEVSSTTEMTSAISAAVGAINVAQIQPVGASVATNALTATLNPTKLDFRSTTLTSGTISTVTLASAASLVVPNGATLGTTNSIAARLVLLAINNAGAIEVAIINLSGGVDLSETGLISTTALSTGSDSANVAYSTTARTSLAYRVVGVIDITQTTAGTWASAPTLVQGVGGMSPSSLPSARSWKSPTRVAATTYTNTTAREREVLVTCTDTSNSSQMVVTINGSTHLISGGFDGNGGTFRPSASFTVPVGSTYSISLTGASLSSWKELD